MKAFVQQHVIQILIGACAVAGMAVFFAARVSTVSDAAVSTSPDIPVLKQNLLGDDPPSMQVILAKHLFVPDREATGQNSFPDLVVKGVYLGTDRNALFSLKSKPQANLRIWQSSVSAALDQVVDPKDPRQPIVEFLREWSIQRIDSNGVSVKHFITGEEEVYAVDYTPEKKVKDDALRGYGQGAIPQNGGGKPAASASKKTPAGSSSKTGARSAPSGTGAFMADRVSGMMKRMSPQQRQQFVQQLQKNSGGFNSSSKDNKSRSGSKTNKSNSKSSKKK